MALEPLFCELIQLDLINVSIPISKHSEENVLCPGRQTSLRTDALDLTGPPLTRTPASMATERSWRSDGRLTWKQKEDGLSRPTSRNISRYPPPPYFDSQQKTKKKKKVNPLNSNVLLHHNHHSQMRTSNFHFICGKILNSTVEKRESQTGGNYSDLHTHSHSLYSPSAPFFRL